MLKNLKKLNLLKLFKLEKVSRQLIFLITAAIFLTANYLISTIPLRLDLSKGKAYTLSDSTKKIVGNLDDLVNIKFFVSSDLPARLLPLKTDVNDLLSEYQKVGRGKIKLKVVDPRKDEAAAKEAREAGIPELQFSQLEQDKYAVTKSYFGIALSYSDKNEIIPEVSDFENLEYNLTSAVYKLVNKNLPKVGLVGVTESVNLQKILSQQFSLEPIDTSTASATKAIDSSVKTVLVFDNGSKSYDAGEINSFKQYLEKKGKLIVFADGVWTTDQLTTEPANHNLFTFLQEYGITIEKNLVLSSSSELVNFGSNEMSLLLPYPFWLKSDNFNPKSSYFSGINQLTFPWVSSLKTEKKTGLEINELVKTSGNSWEQKDNIILNPQEIPLPEEKNLKTFLLAAEGVKKTGGKLVVVASSKFALDKYLNQASNNLEFILNLLSNLASGGALSGIRSRAVVFYPLPTLTESQKDIFKYTNILLLPALFGLWGAFRLIKRK